MARSKASDFFSVESDEEVDQVLSEDEEKGSSKVNTIYEDEEEDEVDEDEPSGKSSIISNKRRRGDAFQSEEDDDDDVEEEEDDVEEEEEDINIEDVDIDERSKSKNKVKPLSKEEVERNLNKIKKSGVVYISRIPPYMKPAKLKQILSRFGEVNRIFLSPEDPKVYAKRVKYGGNKKKSYTEGWAEFVKKRNAKLAAETLNGNIIGGKKSSYYYDDILNVKYLSKFKWQNLTEQIALEAQSRQEKLRAEIAQATRENKIFIENVERHKMIEGIQKKRAENADGVEKNAKSNAQIRRTFDQRQVESRRSDITKKTNEKKIDKTVSRVLSKVF